jgi:hypothetical protein
VAGVIQVAKLLQGWVPWPVALGALAVLLVMGGPSWLESARHRELRGVVRQIGRVHDRPEDRETLVARAFRLAGQRPDRLTTLGREAHRRALPHLRDRAWDALQALDAPAAARERSAITRDVTRRPANLEQLAVEALLAEGAVDAARVRLDLARTHHPNDEALRRLTEQLGRKDHADGSGSPSV